MMLKEELEQMTAVGLIRGLLVFILSKMVTSGKYWLQTSLSLSSPWSKE